MCLKTEFMALSIKRRWGVFHAAAFLKRRGFTAEQAIAALRG